MYGTSNAKLLFITPFLVASLLGPSSFYKAFAVEPHQETSQEVSSIKIEKAELQKAIAKNLSKVAEFNFIRKEAEKLGVKVYLFGGTAAAYAHYVKWDLQRLEGDPRYNPNRFDYKYIHIYRSSQDLDIVVDGSSTAIANLNRAIVDQFPYLQGSKNAWEVRSLREDLGDKLALLNNPDFLNQHTDSNSVGMIEITNGSSDTDRIRDLREWDNTENSGFLRDVLEGKIHYYYSKSHESTKFYKEGRNPPIISVIRYFIKVFQLDLEMRPEDLQVIKRIIDDFDPKSLTKNSYLPKWFNDNAPKLIQNAIDVEFAFNKLDEMGLRTKLAQIGYQEVAGSVSWWMNKEPLRSKELGQPHHGVLYGKTAQELNIDIVSHETTSYLIYEAITRSHKGLPNVLISRSGAPGESAAHGDGFYTMKGNRSGFVGSGFTIRFKMDPKARAGSDFLVESDGQYIVILNRNAIKVISESLSMDLRNYYEWLKANTSLSRDDLGIFQRLRLSMRAQFLNPSEEEKEYLQALTAKDLIFLYERDPAIESKKLLLSLAPTKLQSSDDILNFISSIELWRGQSSQQDQKELLKLIESDYKEIFLQKFLSQKPNQEQLKQAMENGLLSHHSAVFLELMEPYIHSIDDILSVLTVWNQKNREVPLKKDTRRRLIKLGKQFFALNPNDSQVSKFNGLMENEMLVLGLGAKTFSEPLVFAKMLEKALAVKNSERITPRPPAPENTQSERARKAYGVWQKNKKQFFAMEPSFSEVIASMKLLKPIEIQLDLLQYALEKGMIRRRTEVAELMGTLTQSTSAPENYTKVWEQNLNLMIQNYIAMKPSPSEVGELMKSSAIPNSVRTQTLKSYLLQVHSDTDLLVLLRAFPENAAANEFILNNVEILQKINYSGNTPAQLLEQLDHGSAANLVIFAYAKKNPTEDLAILKLMTSSEKTNYQDHLSEIEELWLSAFQNLLTKKPNYDVLIKLKVTLPTVKAYEVYMPALLDSVSSLDQFKEAFNSGFEGFFLHLTSEEWNKYRTITNYLVPTYLESKQQLLVQSPGQTTVNLNNFTLFSFFASSPESLVRIYDLFLQRGGWTSWRNDLSTFKIDQGHGNRLPLPKATLELMGDELSLYHLVNFESLTADNVKAQGLTYRDIILRFLDPPRLARLGLNTNKELIKAFYKLYLLQGIRSISNFYALSRIETIQKDLAILLTTSAKDPRLPFASDLTPIEKSLMKKYKDLPMANYGESGGSWAKIVAAVHFTKDREQLETSLAQDFLEAKNTLRELLAKEPGLKERLSYLDSKIMTCREFRY